MINVKKNPKITVPLNGQDTLGRDTLNILICKLLSYRSRCKRAQVGCVITNSHRIISTGYNGPLLKAPCQDFCDLENSCTHAVHAEANAISFAAHEGIALRGATLYCTYSPCYNCAKMIIQSGIIGVYYEKVYKTDDKKGLNLLSTANVYTEQICLTN